MFSIIQSIKLISGAFERLCQKPDHLDNFFDKFCDLPQCWNDTCFSTDAIPTDKPLSVVKELI
jgi:hypothetical protein